MSVFAVNYLCREVLRDHAFRAAMKADPAKALAGLDLTDDERRALIAGDVGALYRMGVNGFLMGYLARFEVCGLNIAELQRAHARGEGRRNRPAGLSCRYRLRTNSIIAALTSAGRSCWVQWPQPGSMMVARSCGTNFGQIRQ